MNTIQRKIKSGIFIVSFLASTTYVWSQDSIIFIPSWKAGERYDYVLSRLRQDYTNDTLYSTTAFDYDISLSITKAEPEENEITLFYKANKKEHKVLKKTSDKFVLANALEYLTFKLYGFNSLKVVYSVDVSGAFLELKNKAELRNYISTVINAVQHEQTITPDFKGVLEQLKPSLLSDDYVIYSFLSEVHFYHLLYGSQWKIGKEQSKTEVPNPLTGEALSGILITEVKKISAKKIAGKLSEPVYEVVLQQQIDQSKLSGAVNEKIENIYKQIGKDNDETPPIDFNVSYKYTVKNDFITKASYIKTVVSAESKAIEEFILRPVNQPQRKLTSTK